MRETQITNRPLTVRHIGFANWLGFWTLYSKEVQRFTKVWGQTIFAPMITSLLFLAIFSLALGGAVRTVNDMPFIKFLAPGLVMMAIVQNSFANTSSSMMVSKVQGVIVDILMPPLSAGELVSAFALGGVTRGLVVGASVIVAMSFFAPIGIDHLWAVLFFSVTGALSLSLCGLIAGIWAEKFDHMASATNFIIVPLSFLSGTFYSIDRLPDILKNISEINPFFYIIDGFRYGFLGASDGSIQFGLFYLLILSFITWFAAYMLFKKGYKIKS